MSNSIYKINKENSSRENTSNINIDSAELEISITNNKEFENKSIDNNDNNNNNNISLKNLNISYGPVLSEENSSDYIINKEKDNISSLNTSENNKITYVSQSSDPNEENNDLVMVYGNDIKHKNPYKIGKSFSFFYIKEYPIIILGPKCI